MNFHLILYTLGGYLLLFSFAFLPSLAVALFYQEKGMALLFSLHFLGTLLVGGILYFISKEKGKNTYFTKREGLLSVSLIWMITTLIGSFPYFFSSHIPLPISAFFESVSGFTTTGASVLTNIEALPKALLFWRSFTHFLGGLGIVVLFVAILPYLGVASRILFQSEVPGPETEYLKPKVQETAIALLWIYLAFTFAETLALMLCGMSLYDSLCHTFGTLATGGFSTKNASIGHYQSLSIEMVIIFFMILAGMNFSLYYHFLKGRRRIFKENTEFKAYLAIILISTFAIALHLTFYFRSNFWLNLRESLFHVVSIQTTTGYGAGNFEEWTPFAQMVLLLLMLIGGCAGSTGGGIKVVRWIIVIKYIFAQLKKVFHPHGVIPIKLDKKGLPPYLVQSVVALFCLWLIIFAITSILLTAMGMDLITSTTATLATLNNIGPGLGEVGPMDNYAGMPEGAKFLLSLCMLFGRLEIYTLIVIFLPSFWRE